jgi:hypothetical protein
VKYVVNEDQVDRAMLAADLERARTQFHRLLASAGEHDSWNRLSRGTRWTNEQLLFHMVFGYVIVARLLILVRVFGRLPDVVGRVFARLLNAATMPFNVVNYYGSRFGSRFYNRNRMGGKLDRVIDSLQCQLVRERATDFRLGMHYPTRWDPFFREYMTLEDIYRYPGEHFDFHQHQLNLEAAD